MKLILTLLFVIFTTAVFGQCLPDKYQYVDDSCQFTLPDYRDSIAVVENCCLEFYAQNPLPGIVTTTGDSVEVELIARDCQGNEARLSFMVFILDTIPPRFICDSIPVTPEPVAEKRRLIILTDPNVNPAKESDDAMSLVRLMFYVNEFDIEGIVATCSHNLYERYTEPIHEIVDAYGVSLPNLRIHADGWPDEEYLHQVTKLGPASYGTQYALNESPISEGGQLIVNALGVEDDRPIWVAVWGDGAVIVQALEFIRKTQGEQAAQTASQKLRILDNAGQDDSGAWLKAQNHYPDMFYVRWIQGGMAMDSISDTPTGISWFPFCGECAKGDVSYVSDYWVDDNIQPVGPLGALYPDRRYLKEGDSPTLLYLLDNGLGDPERPEYGSWGGRMGDTAVAGVRSIRDPLGRADEFTETEFDPYLMWEFGSDLWNTYQSKWATIFRHYPEFQNDFAARIHWSITPDYLDANHPPRPFVGLDGSKNFVYKEVNAGEVFQLSAAASTDPDDFPLSYKWYQYVGVGSYEGDVSIMEDTANTPNIFIPQDASGTVIHIILAVTDVGVYPLTRYRRIILNVI